MSLTRDNMMFSNLNLTIAGLLLFVLMAVIYYICYRRNKVFLQPQRYALVQRFGMYQRSVQATRRHGTHMRLWPLLESVRCMVDGRLRRLIVPLEDVEDDFIVRVCFILEYRVEFNNAERAMRLLAQPVKPLVDYMRAQFAEVSRLLDKDKQQLYQDTLLVDLKEKITDFMQAHAYTLHSLRVRDVNIASRVAFDLTATRQLLKLLDIDPAERDTNWWERAGAVILQANFAQCVEPIKSISPSLMAYHVEVPTTDNFTPINLAAAIDTCLAEGVGLVISAGNQDTNPLLTLSFIELYALKHDCYTQMILQTPIPNGPFYNAEADYIPMGPPGEDFLPLEIRAGVAAYLKKLNIEEARVTLLTQIGSDLQMSLAFNIFIEHFNSAEDLDAFTRQFYWFIPRSIPLVALSKQSAVAEEMGLMQI